MSTTAWRFSGTEAADEAVVKLQRLNAQEQIDVQDVTVIRWPQYAANPLASEHVTDDRRKMAAMVHKLKVGRIAPAMIESVKGDLTPGTSALVLMSSDAAVETVAKAFQGQPMELIRSDLSVQQQDALRAQFGGGNTGSKPDN